jgi:hypothetical protein
MSSKMLLVGVILNIIGCILQLTILGWRAVVKLQNISKMIIFGLLILVGLISGTVALFVSPKLRIALGSLAVIIPSIIAFSLGCILTFIMSFQGFNAVQISLILLVLASLVALVGSVLIIVC